MLEEDMKKNKGKWQYYVRHWCTICILVHWKHIYYTITICQALFKESGYNSKQNKPR